MRLFRFVGSLVAIVACTFAWCSPANADNYTTFHSDNARDGWSYGGYLNPGYIPGHFVSVATVPLDEAVDAQPLQYTGARTPFGTYPRYAIVATENNSVYSIFSKGGVRWKQTYGAPVTNSCNYGHPTGIHSTPVIDVATNRLYFVAFNSDMQYRLHAVSLDNGNDVLPPKVIAPVDNPPFYPAFQRQRAALLQANGNIYVSFASFCDFNNDVSMGQIFSFSTSDLSLQARYVTTNYGSCPGNYHLGSIWGSGFGPAADASGNLYVSTGNGCISYYQVTPGNGAFSQAVLKLTPNLVLNDNTQSMFAPCDAINESNHDGDLGSGGVTLLPDQTGSVPHLMLAGGKTGVSYVLNRDWLGGWHQGCPNYIVWGGATNGGLFGGHAAWQGPDGFTYVAMGGTHTPMQRYRVNSNGTLSFSASTNVNLSGEGGTSPVVSSNGTQSGSYMLWYLTRPEAQTGTINLVGYDAMNLGAGAYVNVPAGTWNRNGSIAFLSPTVVDNSIYVASDRQLQIFSVSGLRGF